MSESKRGMGRARCMACGVLFQNLQSCPECAGLKTVWASMKTALEGAKRSFVKAHACRHLRGQPKGVDAWCECDAVNAAITQAENGVAATGGET